MTYTIQIRDRRQVTLPTALLKKFNLAVGDNLEIQLDNNFAVIKPKKRVALDAFKEIQVAFAKSAVTEKELQKALENRRENNP